MKTKTRNHYTRARNNKNNNYLFRNLHYRVYTKDNNKKQTNINEYREQQITKLPQSLLMIVYKLNPRYQGTERIVKYIFYTIGRMENDFEI